jgi:hypothetical protein
MLRNLDPENSIAKPNPKEMLDLGRSFFQAGQKLFTPEVSSDATLMCVIPAVVSLSFSVEILLKCFLQIRNGSFKKIHDTSLLFDCLSVPDQELITRKIGFTMVEEVKDELDKISSAFEHWRYAFETKNLPFSSKFTIAFCGALLNIFDSDLKSLFPSRRGKSLIVDRCDD